MQVFVLLLEGAGDDENAYEVAGVFTTNEAAEAKAQTICAEFFYTYKIEEWTLNN